jgi:hypothetical protein
LITFGATTAAMLVAAAVYACTFPVGQTLVPTAAGAPGDDVVATGTVSNTAEDSSKCANDGTTQAVDAECVYEFGIVDPGQVDNSNPQWDGSEESGPGPTCHYETPQTTGDPNDDGSQTVTEQQQLYKVGTTVHQASRTQDGARGLTVTDGEVPTFASGESGPTLACFYSAEALGEGDATNGQDNGAATATVPQPFVVVGQVD